MISNSGLMIGTHIPFQKTLKTTLITAINSGMYSFQFFLGNPQSLRRTLLSEKDIKETKEILDQFPTFIVTHAPYIFNLAKTNNSFESIESLEKEIKQVSLFGGKGVVLHPGSNADKEKGIINISNHINQIKFEENQKLILENMSGQGSMIGSRLEELKEIRDHISKEKQKYIGFCIDTAHIWGMGLYDLSKRKEIDKMFIDLESILGIDNICLFHVNDSKVMFGSKVDRHSLLCEGEIWKNDKEDSLRYLLKKINSYSIPIVLETDPSDMMKFLY
jgi:deoxyribonuclease-4